RVRGILRVLREVLLQRLPSVLVAALLECALQVAHFAFIGIGHGTNLRIEISTYKGQNPNQNSGIHSTLTSSNLKLETWRLKLPLWHAFSSQLMPGTRR